MSLTRLKVLRLSNNSFSGRAFPSFTNFSELILLDLNGTRNWLLPFQRWLRLRVFHLQSCLVSVSVFFSTDNRIADSLDAPLWTLIPLPKLRSLYLANNLFVGDHVDLSWSKFPALVDLNLSSNELWGPLTLGATSDAAGILDVSRNSWACFLPDFPSGMRVMASCSLFQLPTPLVRHISLLPW